MIPGAPIIDDAAIITQRGVIYEIGKYADLLHGFSGTVTDLGDVCVAPGLINAHSHLELAHIQGKTIPGQGFVTWVEGLLAQPIFDLDPDVVKETCRELKRTGVVAVGDIATRFAKEMAGILQDSGLFFTVFVEAIGEKVPTGSFLPQGAFTHGRYSVAGHSLYTTHRDVLRAAKAEASMKWRTFSIHLAEHEDEEDILAGRPSKFLDLLQKRGRLKDFSPPGKGPVEYADQLGLLDRQTLAVHCVRVSDRDIQTLARSRTSVCLCPRSNEFIGVGRAPWEKLFQAGVNLCLGTDSLASNHDLNLWNEAAYFKERYKGKIGLEEVLAMLTTGPARALGLAGQFGTLDRGKDAAYSIVPQEFLELFA